MAVAETDDGAGSANEHLNNRIALTIAILATFLAISTIKSGNVGQALEQAQAERNNSWAWYQAVRVREDMGSYELANLQRSARELPPTATLTVAPARESDAAPAPPDEAQALSREITEQEEEMVRIRARKDEVEARAHGAEAEVAALSRIDDQYDLSDALIAIATALLAICALAKVRWLYWFSLMPTVAGMAIGGAAMANVPIPLELVMSLLN
jgi:hypothetical protein